jgi:hypothetical protein
VEDNQEEEEDLSREIEMDNMGRDLDDVAAILVDTVDRLMGRSQQEVALASMSMTMTSETRESKRARTDG